MLGGGGEGKYSIKNRLIFFRDRYNYKLKRPKSFAISVKIRIKTKKVKLFILFRKYWGGTGTKSILLSTEILNWNLTVFYFVKSDKI